MRPSKTTFTLGYSHKWAPIWFRWHCLCSLIFSVVATGNLPSVKRGFHVHMQSWSIMRHTQNNSWDGLLVTQLVMYTTFVRHVGYLCSRTPVTLSASEVGRRESQFKNRVVLALQGTMDMCNLSICTSIIYVPHIILFILVEMARIPYCVMVRYAQQTQIYCQYRLCIGCVCRWFDKNLV